MTQKTLKQAAADLEKAEKHLEDLQAQDRRCRSAIKTGEDYSEQIEILKKSREEVIGQAFLVGSTPDTASIDKEIASLTKKSADSHVAVQADAQAAKAAIALLAPQIEAAKAAIAEAKGQLGEATAAHAHALFDQAESEYHKAVDDLVAALVKMGATGSVYELTSTLPGKDKLTFRVGHMIAALKGTNSHGLQVKRPDRLFGGYEYGVYPGLHYGGQDEIREARAHLVADMTKQGARF